MRYCSHVTEYFIEYQKRTTNKHKLLNQQSAHIKRIVCVPKVRNQISIETIDFQRNIRLKYVSASLQISMINILLDAI